METILDKDRYGTAANLNEYKQIKCDEIDRRTEELISEGYTYASKVFSLSIGAQINISALNQSRNEISYPIVYNTKDDLDVYNVADATDMNNMYMTALATKKAHLDSGSALKAQVRVAVNQAGVDAVIDNR